MHLAVYRLHYSIAVDSVYFIFNFGPVLIVSTIHCHLVFSYGILV